MQISERILIADRDAELCEELRVKMELSGYLNVDTVQSREMLRYAAERSFYNVIIIEKEMCSAEELEYLLHHEGHSHQHVGLHLAQRLDENRGSWSLAKEIDVAPRYEGIEKLECHTIHMT